jgi:hypothetical protein
MTQDQKKSIELKGAYLTGRREEAQELKAHIARQINIYQDNGMSDAADVLRALQKSILNREHSQITLPPPAGA